MQKDFAQNKIYSNIHRPAHFYRQTVQAASGLQEDISLDYTKHMPFAQKIM